MISGIRLARSSRRALQRPASLRARLVGLVAVPTLCVVVGTIWFTVSRLHELHTAEEVEHHVVELLQVLNAQSSVSQERVPSQALASMEELEVPTPVARLLLGFDPTARMAEVRPVADAALADPAFTDIALDLAVVRRLHPGDPAASMAAWDRIDRQLVELRHEHTEELERASQALRSSITMHTAIDSFVLATELSDANSRISKDLLAIREKR